ncbi:MFS transporter [Paenibacillus sp. 1P07SE]|uniref:MFS transporter n=1 Tax=Paenibacillus sp. 1P07SE TaxID=3132209 RepID=UPI0039A6D7F5
MMMSRVSANLLLFVLAVMYWVGFSMVRPIVSLYFNEVGYSVTAIGLFMAAQAVIPVLLAMPAGSAIDRIGTRRATLVGSGMLLASGLLYWTGGAIGSVLLILAGQIISGLGSLMSWGALQAGAAQTARRFAEERRKDRMLANFAFVNSLAQFAGPVTGGYLSDQGGYSSVFLLFAGLAGVSLLLGLRLPELDQRWAAVRTKLLSSANAACSHDDDLADDDKRRQQAGDNPGRGRGVWSSYVSGYILLRDNRPFMMAIIVNGVLFVLIDMQSAFFPLYLSGAGLSNTEIGWMLSIGAAASILIRPLVGHLIGWLGHQRIVLYSMVLGSVCLLSLVLTPPLWVLGVIVFLWGICSGMNQPMALIMVARTVRSSQQGMGMSLRTMSNRIVQVANPVGFGILSGWLGLTLGFGAVGCLMMGASVLVHRFYRASA